MVAAGDMRSGREGEEARRKRASVRGERRGRENGRACELPGQQGGR